MAIDYRYHLGSIVAIFVALLLGLLIGIGLAPRPEDFSEVVTGLKKEYQQTRDERKEEVEQLKAELGESEAVGKEAVSAVIADRLADTRIALVMNHDLGREFGDQLRALLTQAGAKVVSTTTFTRDFIAMPDAVRKKVSTQLLLYPPQGTPFRAVIARAIARDLATSQSKLIHGLHVSGLLKSSSGSVYTSGVDAVLLVGGMNQSSDASPDGIDVPLITELKRLGVRVVGCEARDVKLSCIPTYKAQDISTVDNVDTLAGRLAVVFVLGDVEGHFGVKETADRLVPDLRAAAP
jgi:hypothetical protein